jgi:hypothetical protein
MTMNANKPNRKHVKEARRPRHPLPIAHHLSGLRNHGTGKSASALANKQAKAARLMRRKVA